MGGPRPRGDVAEILHILGTKHPKKVTLVPQPGMVIPYRATFAGKHVACVQASFDTLTAMGAKLVQEDATSRERALARKSELPGFAPTKRGPGRPARGEQRDLHRP